MGLAVALGYAAGQVDDKRRFSFQLAQRLYDVTARFCDRYIDKRSRTRDQMVPSAYSGAPNLAEGSAQGFANFS